MVSSNRYSRLRFKSIFQANQWSRSQKMNTIHHTSAASKINDSVNSRGNNSANSRENISDRHYRKYLDQAKRNPASLSVLLLPE